MKALSLERHLRKDLVDTIAAVHSCKERLSPETPFELAEFVADEVLTPAEIDVLRLISAGNFDTKDQLFFALPA